MNKVYLSLGSNISPKKDYLNKAIAELELKLGKIISKSNIYETPAWGFISENFYNMAIEIHTEKTSIETLTICMNIERELGRIRVAKNQYSARVIDIDILFFNNECIKTELLTVPHALLHQRDFVLLPLQEIAPNFLHPIINQTIKDIRSGLTEKIEEVIVE